MTTITASSTIGLYLNSPTFINPIVVPQGVTLTGDYRGDAIYASSGFWTVINAGVIAGAGTNVGGIHLGAGGEVTNQTSGVIGYASGNYSDIYITGGAGTVTNAGTINAGVWLQTGGEVANETGGKIISKDPSGGYGVGLHIGGTVTNAGEISGLYVGIDASAGGGTVTNQLGGTIVGPYAGVLMGFPGQTSAGGRYLLNQTGGTIVGDAGVIIGGTIGQVINAGEIAGKNAGIITHGTVTLVTGAGVSMGAGGAVTNELGGTITGVSYGVNISNGTGTVVNYGSIGSTGTVGHGIELQSGGAVTNAASGSITGAIGVEFGTAGGSGTLVNAGGIAGVGANGRGIVLDEGGSISNTGTISGAAGAGIYAKAGASTVANSGWIFSDGSHSAVALFGGGYITNQSGGTLSSAGSNAVYVKGGAGTVINAGEVAAGGAHSTVILFDGGLVANKSGGTVTGTTLHNAIYTTGTTATVTNYGVLIYGVNLKAGGSVTNETGGTIASPSGTGIQLHAAGYVGNRQGGTISSALQTGVFINSGPGTVVNSGMIVGNGNGTISYPGVDLGSGGFVSNASTGTITGGNLGIFVFKGRGVVVNSGSVAGTASQADGVALYTGGVVTNETSAAISGVNEGVYLEGHYIGTISGIGFVTNAAFGLISGGNDGVLGTDNNNIAVANYGSIAGTGRDGIYIGGGNIINGASGSIRGGIFGVSVLTGGTLTNAGTIIGSGGTAVAFGDSAPFADRVVVDPGAVFVGVVNGGNTIGSTIVSALELASASSTGSLSGIGTEFVNFGSIAFDSGAHWFITGDTAGLAGTISDFAFGDTIEVSGITATGSSYVGGVLTLNEASGSVELKLPGSFTTNEFLVTNVAAGADVSLAAPCFVAGTRIRTERGAVTVEALRVGDRVPVVMGSEAQPIVWIGHRRVDCRRHPQPTEVWPVCVNAGAFGPGRPFRDLWLSPDHAVFVNGVLIPIRYLVNGRTIRQEARDAVTYWHVELAEHNVLYAEGVPAESYLDTGNRSAFANGGAAMDLHADFARGVWEKRGCAPLVLNGTKLAATKQRLHERVSALGHRTTNDPGIKVLVDGRTVVAKRQAQTLHVRLCKAARHVRLISRVWVPAHMRADAEDTRALGIAVSRVWVDGAEIGLDAACFTQGWHAPEQHWRWTEGDGWIDARGGRELAFEAMMSGTYWDDDERGEVRAA